MTRKTHEQLQAAVSRRFRRAMQTLQDDGIEVVLIAVETGDPPGGAAVVAGTVRSVLRVRGILAQGLRELEQTEN